jgi:hypothetical protein
MRKANTPSISSKGNCNTSSSSRCEKHMELSKDLPDEEWLLMEGPKQVKMFLLDQVKVVKKLLKKTKVFE